MRLLLGLTVYASYLQTLGGVVAPFLAADLRLDDAQITAIAGFASLGAFGTAVLARSADRRGRRGLLLACFALLPVLSLASAIAPGVVSYTLCQIGITALLGAFLTGIVVVMIERSSEAWRATGQAWFGLAGAGGGGLVIGLAALGSRLPWGWRGLWLVAVLPIFLIAPVRRALAETDRFTRARDEGQVAASRARDLFRAPWRGRTIALLCVAALRPIALIATSTWPYYYMVKSLALSPATASLVFVIGGGVGQLGNPLGARLSARWGRRPTAVWGSALAVASGIAFYWIPLGPDAVLELIGLTAVTQGATAAFSVADRLLGGELFPTTLRATFSGVAWLMLAGAALVANFGLSVLVAPLGGLVPAISWLSIVTFVPATVIFLLGVPETRGMSLEEAAGEDVTRGDRGRP